MPPSPPNMKMIVGLGNPGRKYEGTRHNIGFVVLAKLAAKCGDGSVKARFRGEVMEGRVGDERILLLSPLTYMNLSGESVREAKDFYKIEIEDILIVCDDFSLPLGKLRMRPKGSSGGQKGLANTIKHLGTEEVPRLRFGIGPPPENWDVADYVLSKFAKDEQKEIDHAVEVAANAAMDWVTSGMEDCMNRYN